MHGGGRPPGEEWKHERRRSQEAHPLRNPGRGPSESCRASHDRVPSPDSDAACHCEGEGCGGVPREKVQQEPAQEGSGGRSRIGHLGVRLHQQEQQ